MLGGLGTTELIIILVIVLVIFGAGKLPEVGGALGKGIRNFKRASKGEDDIDVTPAPAGSPAPESLDKGDASQTAASTEKVSNEA
ncbi:MAG: twin-arginine translocase TatA/TatE family subunit [Candidatus Dadabacteria bacterium]|nr:MAG: twin-arginine translocase TatA/TatE family subunit [Candidatus Dadabacteria bacterium]